MQFVEFFAVNHKTGTTLPYASVSVYLTGTNSPIQLYDESGSPISNATEADAIGRIGFACIDGTYDIQITSGAYSAPLIEKFQIYDIAGLSSGLGALLAMQIAAGAVGYLTLSALNGDLAHAAGALGVVSDDPTPTNDGVYLKLGASGSGSWQQTSLTWVSTPIATAAAAAAAASASAASTDAAAAHADRLLADADATATHADRLLADADVVQTAASASTAVSASVEAISAVEAAGVTLFFATKAAAVSALSTIPANGVVEVFVDETQSNHRTIYQKISGALVLQADLDLAAASLGIYNTVALATAAYIPAFVQRLYTKTRAAVGDGGGASYKRIGSAPAHPMYFTSADGAIWSLDEARAASPMFGIVSDGATDNTTAFQNAMAYIAATGASLYLAPGIACLTGYFMPPDGAHIYGDGDKSCVRSTYAGSGPDQLAAPIWQGYWAINFNGQRTVGSSAPYTRQINLYSTSAACGLKDNSVTMATPSDAGNFTAGAIAYIRGQEFISETGTGVDVELPLQNNLVRIVSADTSTGIVIFEEAIGFASPTAPYLCAIKSGAADSYGPVYWAQGILIENLRIEGYSAFGNTASGAYKCVMRNITGDVQTIITSNGLAHCLLDGFTGIFHTGAGENKFCGANSRVTNILTWCPDDVSGVGPGLLSVGEYCFGIVWDGFDIVAPKWNGGHLVQFQPGSDCVFRNGRIFAPSSTNDPVAWYSDDGAVMTGCDLIGCKITHGSSTSLVVYGASAGTKPPQACAARGNSFVSTATGEQFTVYMQAGSGFDISHNRGPGRLHFEAATSGNLVTKNIVADGVNEDGGSNNQVIDNFVFAGGVMTAFGNNPPSFPSIQIDTTLSAMSEEVGGGWRLSGQSASNPTTGEGAEAQYISPGTGVGYLRFNIVKRASGGDTYHPFQVKASEIVFVDPATETADLIITPTYIAPGADGAQACGQPGLRWSNVYGLNSTINTSDVDQKTEISPIPDAVLDAVGDVDFQSYKMKVAVAKKGSAARLHAGLMAQQLHAAMIARGVADPFVWGVLCYDEWPERIETFSAPDPETGKVTATTRTVAAGSAWSIRYEELLVLEMARLRKVIAGLTAP